MAASSSFGSASRRSAVDWARAGREVERVERWFEEVMMASWERLESAWSDSRREWVVCERDCGSLSVRADRGRVVRRLR